jgi:hypothetical protein
MKVPANSEANQAGDIKHFAPGYPRLALSMIFGTVTLIGLAAIGAVVREFLDGVAQILSVGLQILLSAAALHRLARIRVSLVDNAELVVVNPFRTRTVSLRDVATTEEVGFIYKWLRLRTAGGETIPVAASFYVLEPHGPISKELNDLLTDAAGIT